MTAEEHLLLAHWWRRSSAIRCAGKGAGTAFDIRQGYNEDVATTCLLNEPEELPEGVVRLTPLLMRQQLRRTS